MLPLPGACCTHRLPGGVSTRHPKAGVSWEEGLPHLRCGQQGPEGTAGPLLRRHHGHLPVGGLQPPGAARAGPVRHHLAAPASRPPAAPHPHTPQPGRQDCEIDLKTRGQRRQAPCPTSRETGPHPLLLQLENQGWCLWVSAVGGHAHGPRFQIKLSSSSLARLGVLGGV